MRINVINLAQNASRLSFRKYKQQEKNINQIDSFEMSSVLEAENLRKKAQILYDKYKNTQKIAEMECKTIKKYLMEAKKANYSPLIGNDNNTLISFEKQQANNGDSIVIMKEFYRTGDLYKEVETVNGKPIKITKYSNNMGTRNIYTFCEEGKLITAQIGVIDYANGDIHAKERFNVLFNNIEIEIDRTETMDNVIKIKEKYIFADKKPIIGFKDIEQLPNGTTTHKVFRLN